MVRRLILVLKLNPICCFPDVCWEVVTCMWVKAEELLSIELSGDCGHVIGWVGLEGCFHFVLVWLLRLCWQLLVVPLVVRVGGC